MMHSGSEKSSSIKKTTTPALEHNAKEIESTNKSTTPTIASDEKCPSPADDTNDLDDKVQESNRGMSNQEEMLLRLKQQSEEASKTIERLQMQLKQQSDYELLKREVL